VIRAYLYLVFTSVRNSLAHRFKRLRQPKYLFGALAGAAYFYFFVFRHVFRTSSAGQAQSLPMPAEAASLFEPLTALGLLFIVILYWLFGRARAALQFSEAEVAFLFPAPVPRHSLIHFKLLRSQLGILVSAFFLTLLFRRGSGSAVAHATGWWIMLSTLNLHELGASFARERLLDFGLNPVRRRLLVGGLVVALAAGSWFAVRQAVPPMSDRDVASFSAMAHYANRVLEHPPVSWVLMPFRWAVRPYFAADAMSFTLALGPAALLLAAHYFWVVRSNVSFEEASAELAARRARQIAAMRAGDWRAGSLPPRKPKPEPFRLAPHGWTPLAFLWKNLIALGPFYRLRTWLIACAVVVVLTSWLAASPERQPFLVMCLSLATGLGIALVFMGPMFMRREIQQTLPNLDVTKAYPLTGWRLVVGQLLTPVTLLTLVEWLLLLTIVFSLRGAHKIPGASFAAIATGAAGLGLLVPLLCGLMLCVPYAGVLYFPAWGQAMPGAGGGGIELMGQRLIFTAGYLVVLVVALLPAAVAGGLAFFVASQLIGPVLAIVVTTLLAAGVLAFELAGAVWWLGEKVDRFDLSTEMPR
jgi:ABC-2 type transport system permease protein